MICCKFVAEMVEAINWSSSVGMISTTLVSIVGLVTCHSGDLPVTGFK